MTNVLVRGLDDNTHRELARRASERGQSLQQFLATELTRLARTPTVADVLRRVEGRTGVSSATVGFAQAVADLDAERGRS